MTKVLTILVIFFAFTLTNQAQMKGKHGDIEKMTVAQQTDLAVKKMTLKLDLTESQQKQIRPILAKNLAKRKAMHEKQKALQNSGKKREKLSADEHYKKQDDRLNEMIAFKADMKRILTKEQFDKFEKSAKLKMGKRKQKMKKKRKEHKE